MPVKMSESEESVLEEEEEEEDEEEEFYEEDNFEDNALNFLDNKDNVRESFPLGNFQHKLFLTSSYVNDKVKHGHDAVRDLLERYQQFQRSFKFRNVKKDNRDYGTVFKNLEEQIKGIKNERILKVPFYVPNFMKFVKLQPDESFYGNYNWYYTGGCLQHFCIDGNYYLLFVKGKNRNNLGVASLKTDKTWCIDTTKKVKNVKTQVTEEIFQVLVNNLSQNTLIGLRQKHTCSIYNYMKNKFAECFSMKSEIPFVSFGLSSVHNELCTINAKQRLSFWDIEQKETPMATYFPSDNLKCDKWHNLWYSSDPSVISLATRKSLKWMDRRTCAPNYSVNIIDNFKGTLDDEEISIHFESIQNPYFIYVGTSVNLFVVDVRSPLSAVRRWSHHLPSPPLYSCVTSLSEENELACIANHSPGSVILAFNNSSKDYPLVEFPTRIDTLLSCQASGLCLDPSMTPRMMSSLIGLTSLNSKESEKLEILTQTAALDVFSQALFENNFDSPNFEDLVSSSENLNARERWNLKGIRDSLGIEELKLSRKIPMKTEKKQEWQVSKEELVEYKDVLAPIILEEWDANIGVGEKLGISSSQKVSAWLDSFNFNPVVSSFQNQRPSWEEG